MIPRVVLPKDREPAPVLWILAIECEQARTPTPMSKHSAMKGRKSLENDQMDTSEQDVIAEALRRPSGAHFR